MYSTTAHNTRGSHFALAEVLFREIVQSLFELCKLLTATTFCRGTFHSLIEYGRKIHLFCLLLSTHLLVSFEGLLLLYWMKQFIIKINHFLATCFHRPFYPLSYLSASLFNLSIYNIKVPYLWLSLSLISVPLHFVITLGTESELY